MSDDRSTPEPIFEAHKTTGRSFWSRETVIALVVCVIVPAVIAYGFGTEKQFIIIGAVIGLAGAAFGMRYPFWTLALFVVLLYVRPGELIPALNGIPFTLVAASISSISVIFQKLMDHEPPVKTPPAGLIVGFLFAVTISDAKTGGFAAAFMDVVKLVALYLIVINLANTPSRYRTLTVTVILFTAFLSLYSIFLYYSGGALKRGDELQAQGTGIFSDPNDMSASIVAALGLALGNLASSKKLERVFYVALTVILIWGVYLSNSRGGMIALAATMGAFIMTVSKNRVLALIIAVIVVLGFFTFGPSRMKEMDTKEESANSRFHFWINATEHFMTSPIVGVGYGNFPSVNNGATAHNTFVLCYVELGLLGYFCWIGCLFYCFRGIYTGTRLGDPPKYTSISASDSAPVRGSPNRSAEGDRNGLKAGKIKPPGKPREYFECLGARLSLAGFLVAALFISRTYMPVLYLLMSLPIAQQVAAGKGRTDYSVTPQQRFRDTFTILGIAIASICMLYAVALHLQD